MKQEIKVLIIDDDLQEAELLSKYLVENGFTVYTTVTNLKEAVSAIEHWLPDTIILSMSSAGDDIVGFEIARHIHENYYIPVLLSVEYHEREDLQKYIDILPYSCHFKTKDNYFEQILNDLKFSGPHIVGRLCKYRAKVINVTRMDIDEKDEPVSKVDHEYSFEDKEIKLCDILYIKAGNAFIKNSVLIRLQSDKSHYYAYKGTLVECLQWLNNHLFTHINGSYIVNNEKITAWNLYRNVIVDDIVVSIGRYFRDQAKIAYNYYHPEKK